MYDNLVITLRNNADHYMTVEGAAGLVHLLTEAADAIEELQKVLDAVNDAHNEGYDVGYWAGRRDYEPKWIPVTERLPESVDDDVLVTDGEGCAVGYWRPDAQAWDSTDFGWLENRSEPPCGIHTVTHWMPLPPLSELPKEEA